MPFRHGLVESRIKGGDLGTPGINFRQASIPIRLAGIWRAQLFQLVHLRKSLIIDKYRFLIIFRSV